MTVYPSIQSITRYPSPCPWNQPTRQRSSRSVAKDSGPARETSKTGRSLSGSDGAAAASTGAGAAGAGAGTALGRDLGLQVRDRLLDVASVSQVTGSDEERAAANAIRGVAVSLRLLRREVGDLAVLLLVAGVAVKHDTSDTLLDGRVKLRDGVNHDGRALRVAGGDDDGVRALLGRVLENADGFVVGAGSGAARQGVGADAGLVGTADTLAGDVVVVGLLQAVAGGWADGGTLRVCKSRSWDVTPGILSMISNSPCCRSQWNRGRR